jgi:hypothetical protein
MLNAKVRQWRQRRQQGEQGRMAAKGVKWGTVESRAYEPGSAALPSDAASDSEGDDARQPPQPRAQRPIEPTPPQPQQQQQQQQQQQRRLPVTLYPEAPPPQQVFEGSGDVASATAEAQRAARLISANGVDAYEAATEGAKAGALAAGREAKRLAQREFSAERARAVAAKMEAAAQLDPADALPFGFVTKLREGHEAAVTHCTWADDARHIASCDAAGKVCVWDTHTCSVRREYRGHTGAVAQVRCAPGARARSRSPHPLSAAPSSSLPQRPNPSFTPLLTPRAPCAPLLS